MSANETARIAVIICTGSYHTPAPYEPFRQSLEGRGFEAYCPQRPTCDLSLLNVGDVSHPDFDSGPPVEGYPTDSDDVEVVNQLLEKLIVQEGKDVIMLGHSSGGLIASQAAVPQLQYKSRHAKGQRGGVIGIFFENAFVIPVGESVHTFFQPKEGPIVTPPFMRFHVSCFSAQPFYIPTIINIWGLRNTEPLVWELSWKPTNSCLMTWRPRKQPNGLQH